MGRDAKARVARRWQVGSPGIGQGMNEEIASSRGPVGGVCGSGLSEFDLMRWSIQ